VIFDVALESVSSNKNNNNNNIICSESLCNREGGAVYGGETFEECSILFKFKEDEDFNHRNTLSISRIKI
jgi:hypothetical protein